MNKGKKKSRAILKLPLVMISNEDLFISLLNNFDGSYFQFKDEK